MPMGHSFRCRLLHNQDHVFEYVMPDDDTVIAEMVTHIAMQFEQEVEDVAIVVAEGAISHGVLGTLCDPRV